MDRSRYPHSQIRDLTYLKKNDFIVQAAVDAARALGLTPAATSVLEIGCGTGSVSLSLAEQGFPVLGLEINGRKAEEARRRNPFPHARFLEADAVTWETEERFQVIVCSEVLEHLERPAGLLGRLVSLLAPGGWVVVTVPNGYGAWEVLAYRWNPRRLVPGLLRGLRLRAGRLPPFRGRPAPAPYPQGERHVQRFTFRRIRRLVEECGLELVPPVGHSCFLAPVFPFSLCRRWPRLLWPLEALDLALADRLPLSAVSGWYLRCRPAGGIAGLESAVDSAGRRSVDDGVPADREEVGAYPARRSRS